MFDGMIYKFLLIRYTLNGTLDNTFGVNGILTTIISSYGSFGNELCIQSDGKIVVSGTADNGENDDFAVVRYNNDGSLDSTFGNGGFTITGIGVGDDYSRSCALQTDGKILVVGGCTPSTNQDFAVVRYNSDGTLDNSFGNNGIAITSVGTSDDWACDVAVQSDGKIVISGKSYSSLLDKYQFALIRYNQTGTLDNTFNSNGIALTPIGGFSSYHPYSVAIQPNGKIVMSGRDYVNGWDEFALTRYESDGSLDATFGTSGIVITSIRFDNDLIRNMTLQEDGKILVVGRSSNGYNFDYAVARFNSGDEVPVELISFSGKFTGTCVKLYWTTATETNNSGFEIERKLFDSWESIGFIQGNGSTTEPHTYEFSDPITGLSTNKNMDYRLKQIDYNGSYNYSNIIEIDISVSSEEYKLYQNYPNPFNPSTKITYSIPIDDFVLLKIYNSIGEEIETLINENKSAGTYQIDFKADNLPGGIYFYRLNSGNYTKTNKMVVLK